MSASLDLLPAGPLATGMLVAWALLALWWLLALERRRAPDAGRWPGHLYPFLPLVAAGLWSLSAAWPPALTR